MNVSGFLICLEKAGIIALNFLGIFVNIMHTPVLHLAFIARFFFFQFEMNV